MAVSVTLRIFSGRRNPTRWLKDDEVRGLVTRLRALPANLGGKVFRLGGLGYHGFRIEPGTDQTEPELRRPFTVYGGTADWGDAPSLRGDAGRDLERWLLTNFSALDPRAVSRALREFDTIYDDPDCGIAPATKKTLPGRPAFAPAPWNTSAASAANNCYSYANNKRFTTGAHATPGEGAGVPVPVGDCADFLIAIKKDHLKRITSLPANGAPLALFVTADQSDYHFYRQDKSGLWSHMPGGWPARDCDESGYKITDPESADTLDYIFCDYFKTGPLAKKTIK